MADVGGARGLARTAYGREFLPESRMTSRVMVYLREDGRLVAAAALMRTAAEPEFDEREVTVLHRAQPLASVAYAAAGAPRLAFERAHLLEAAGLRPRQMEVARMAAGGSSNAEIAQALMISPETVKRHLSTVYAKMDIRSRTELALRLVPIR
jgi:DNA-binding CsgD family transcriptional regulator